MNAPVLLHGTLATHRRGRILQEAVCGCPDLLGLPDGRAIVLEFGEAFQAAEQEPSAPNWSEWTKSPGHLLLLLPPFGTGGL
jgi:hypothetical protein